MPKSKEQIQGDLINIEKSAAIDVAPLTATRLQAVWDRLTSKLTTNLPPEMGEDLPLRSATGTAWYDANADSTATYRYKIEIINGTIKEAEVLTGSIKYPARKFITEIKPALINPTKAGIYAEFEVLDKGRMARCKILRSYYLRGGFQEIDAKPLFMRRGGKIFICFTDNTVVAKVPYTYTVLPIDAAGNRGYASPEIKVFDVAEKSIVPSVHQFRAYSDISKRAIRLGWKLGNTKNISSIDIYKSDSYNGNYVKVASARATDTSWYDLDVKPITTYFYTVRLTGQFESSPASPRIPGILRAADPNLFPPRAIQLKQDSDKVILTWEKNESDTRAYYVYRADGNGVMKQLGPPIITDSTNVTYVDKLPFNVSPKVYTYSVADENTSYAISPKSIPLHAYTFGSTTLPIPYNVVVRKIADNKLQIIWPDMRGESQAFAGYMLYRRIRSSDGTNTATTPVTNSVISSGVNTYIDSTITDGAVYYYSVRTVGPDQKKLSSPSLEAGFTIAADVPSQVSNVKAIPSANAVVLSWNNPFGENLQGIQIFRALEGKAPETIATISPDKQSYTDKEVVAGNVYYYTFRVTNKKGRSSPVTDAVGIKLLR
jgi:fibronectin type 3 domain-containing protein